MNVSACRKGAQEELRGSWHQPAAAIFPGNRINVSMCRKGAQEELRGIMASTCCCALSGQSNECVSVTQGGTIRSERDHGINLLLLCALFITGHGLTTIRARFSQRLRATAPHLSPTALMARLRPPFCHKTVRFLCLGPVPMEATCTACKTALQPRSSTRRPRDPVTGPS